MNWKKFTSLLLLFLIISSNLSFLDYFSSLIGQPVDLNKYELKSATYWDLTGSSIIIDDLDPTKNWSFTEANYDWCHGSGTWKEPYVIENVTIDGESLRTCISIQNSNVFFRIKNCTLYNSGTGTTRAGIKLENVNNGFLNKNNCSQNGYGIHLISTLNTSVLENLALNNAQSGIYLTSSSHNNKIINNTASDNLNAGISIFISDYNLVSNNTVNNNNKNGIYLYSASFCTILNNICNNNGHVSGDWHGIYLYSDCRYNNVTGNNAHYNDWSGISIQPGFDEPHHNIISESLVSHNHVGILIKGNSVQQMDAYSNTIHDNFAYQNEIGIHLFNARDNLLFENNLSNNNQEGIYINKILSINNLLYKNRFIGNFDNADDVLGGNEWDNGSIGNFYDDYTGKDEDDDGIGDIPYLVSVSFYNVSIIDNYPIWEDGDDIPIISVSKPINNTFYGSIPPNYEVSIIASDFNTSWYSLNDGINYTLTHNSGIINQSAWDACGNGTVKIDFYVNDTAGNLGHDEVQVFKDIYLPDITIISPGLNQVFGYTPINFEVLVDETNLNLTWYTLNGGSNFIFNGTTGMVDNDEWDNCENGSVIIRFYANDSAGNIGFGEITVRKDIEKPNISIVSPTVHQLFGNSTFSFELTINEANLNATWYTIDDGLNNFTFVGTTGSIDQNAWNACGNGTVTLRFFANDSVGNVAFKEIIVRKDKIRPSINISMPEPYYIFGNSTFAYELQIEEANLHSIWYSFNNGITVYAINQSIGLISQESWDLIGNGTVILTFYANDSLGNLGVSKVTIKKNLFAPDILFDFSTTYLNTTKPEYYHKGLEISCEILNVTSLLWVKIFENSSGWMVNHSMTDIGNGWWSFIIDINSLEWSDQLNIYFLTKDILGYVSINNNFSNMYRIKIHDFQAPIITISSPSMNQLSGIQAPTFNIAITELYFQEKWYSLNGGTNITFTTENQFDQNEWSKLQNGTVLIRFYARDLAGNSNYSDVIIRKDAYSPIITVLSPSPDESFQNNAPDYSLSVIEEDLEYLWYTLDNSIIQHFITNFTGIINQDAWNDFPQGEVSITFYAQDRAGNIGIESVIVIKRIPPPAAILGYDTFFFVGGIAITLVIIIKKLKISNLKVNNQSE